jgi:NAD(P)-dependent dehydrogenase (short-subunit alcohol dehydrogenase family)
MSQLAGEVALVTGGASGIGLAVVARFISEGCRVGVADLDQAALEMVRSRFGAEVVTVVANVSTPEGNERAVKATTDAFGKLDIFVGNAGIFDGFREFADLSLDNIFVGHQQIFDVNVRGLLLGARASLRDLVRSRGCMIFTLSISSLCPDGGGVMYVASKHAALGAMRQLAHELAPVVRVNGVAAGATRTPIRWAPAFGPTPTDYDSREVDAAIEAITPLSIRAEAVDHAGAYVLLASRTDGRLLTGTVIETDAGFGVRGLRRTRGGDRLPARFEI